MKIFYSKFKIFLNACRLSEPAVGSLLLAWVVNLNVDFTKAVADGWRLEAAHPGGAGLNASVVVTKGGHLFYKEHCFWWVLSWIVNLWIWHNFTKTHKHFSVTHVKKGKKNVMKKIYIKIVQCRTKGGHCEGWKPVQNKRKQRDIIEVCNGETLHPES